MFQGPSESTLVPLLGSLHIVSGNISAIIRNANELLMRHRGAVCYDLYSLCAVLFSTYLLTNACNVNQICVCVDALVNSRNTNQCNMQDEYILTIKYTHICVASFHGDYSSKSKHGGKFPWQVIRHYLLLCTENPLVGSGKFVALRCSNIRIVCWK